LQLRELLAYASEKEGKLRIYEGPTPGWWISFSNSTGIRLGRAVVPNELLPCTKQHTRGSTEASCAYSPRARAPTARLPMMGTVCARRPIQATNTNKGPSGGPNPRSTCSGPGTRQVTDVAAGGRATKQHPVGGDRAPVRLPVVARQAWP
jgi:hypothetical protein